LILDPLYMTTNGSLGDIEKLESNLWEAADNLRANSKLTSSEYCMPVLAVIFLRHAANRFEAASRQIADDQAAGRMPKRKVTSADYVKRRALFLPEEARYERILATPKEADLSEALVGAMTAIEESFEPLSGVLPKDFAMFERTVIEDLLKIFNREALRTASGDVFGRIYEYFLMKFAMQGAQDSGEFFTPPSLVQTIVNVIEPHHGVVADLACGSGGMFVQSSHFIEAHGQDTMRRVTFYGQEKTATTIKLAKMNLAVHGLEGDIREANTFYEDVHRLPDGRTLWGNCDFGMANPPFNVDMVDAEKIKDDRRLPFGLPGAPLSPNSTKFFRVPSIGAANICTASLSMARPMGFAVWAASSSRKMLEGCHFPVSICIAASASAMNTTSRPIGRWTFGSRRLCPLIKIGLFRYALVEAELRRRKTALEPGIIWSASIVTSIGCPSKNSELWLRRCIAFLIPMAIATPLAISTNCAKLSIG